jgi:hypothetical protein
MRHAFLIAAFALAACARSEPVDEEFGEDLANADNALAEALADDDEQVRSGSWLPGAEGAYQAIAFQQPNGEILFRIRCDDRGGLVLQRPGLVSRGNLALMQLRTGDTVRRLAATTAAGPPPMVQASVPYNDQLIGALMTFDEPLEVSYEGLETLALPPSPAVGDLVRTCQGNVGATRQQVGGEAVGATPQQQQGPAADDTPQPSPATDSSD